MGRYYGTLHAAVEAHGGTVVKLLGDGVMAAFGLKRVAEDDALRGVRAALAMQRAFRALAREQAGLGLRVAVNTGEVVVDAASPQCRLGSGELQLPGDRRRLPRRIRERRSGGGWPPGHPALRH
jgi:class 3 adenylate cyclase